MNDQALTDIAAELTKLNFLLEALWANVALNHGASPDDVDALGAELLRQFSTLPAQSTAAQPEPANDTDLRDLAAQRLQTFFRRLRARVETVQGH